MKKPPVNIQQDIKIQRNIIMLNENLLRNKFHMKTIIMIVRNVDIKNKLNKLKLT